MAAKWQRFKILIDKDYSATERKVIAQEVIDHVIKRSKSGKDKNNAAFPKYSKEYKQSTDFKIAGKSSKVNLTLSGEMLHDLDVLSSNSGKLLIGYENGTFSNGKADGNVRGTYGKKTSSGKKRDFMGISGKDLDIILRKFPLDDKKARFKKVTELLALTQKAEEIT